MEAAQVALFSVERVDGYTIEHFYVSTQVIQHLSTRLLVHLEIARPLLSLG